MERTADDCATWNVMRSCSTAGQGRAVEFPGAAFSCHCHATRDLMGITMKADHAIKLNKLQTTQKKLLRILTSKDRKYSTDALHNKLENVKIKVRNVHIIFHF